MTGSLPSPEAPAFSRATRDERVAQLNKTEFDVVVIGGGITGAGVARDAAMRGLRVALLEAGDLAQGTSSASSKLVHGGLRYLEQRNVGLVLESVNERARLMNLAPHLVRPMPFFFPVYEKRPRPLWMVGLGLWIYEVLAAFRVPARHKTLRGARARDAFPALDARGLDGGVLYYDCATDDARLVLETAIGAHEAGAWILPRMRVEGFVTDRGQVRGVVAKDALTGGAYTVNARLVINATGPWTDRVLGMRRHRPRVTRPTKGSHIVVRRDRLPIDATVMLWTGERDGDGFLFAIPSNESVFIGTTDTDFSGDYDRVRVTGAEVEHFLEHVNASFPGVELTPDDVVGSWAGLRPLLSTGSAEDAQEVPRDHEVLIDPDGLITIAGGKLTTYRLMARDVVDAVAETLRSDGLHVGRCPTGAVRLPGAAGIERKGGALRSVGASGRALEEDTAREFGRDVLEHLRSTYGGRWPRIIERARSDERLGLRMDPELPYLWAEVDHAVQEEMACTIVDVMRRRTQVLLRSRDQGAACAADVGARMAQLLGWGADELEAQMIALDEALDDARAWRKELGLSE